MTIEELAQEIARLKRDLTETRKIAEQALEEAKRAKREARQK